ncbi:hypothetical protein NQ318_016186 [Aromia moschata]|uniref:Transposase Tc1-like domain-containing protein n=1 Tax=Aromia moschata TaxID=1265417 RepID=A0AAV8YGJ6_9CUCU|nr:hypothetical protein NQ318_016186 [Aromia moschata]
MFVIFLNPVDLQNPKINFIQNQKINNVLLAIQENHHSTLNQLASDFNTAASTVHKIMKKAKYHPYKVFSGSRGACTLDNLKDIPAWPDLRSQRNFVASFSSRRISHSLNEGWKNMLASGSKIPLVRATSGFAMHSFKDKTDCRCCSLSKCSLYAASCGAWHSWAAREWIKSGTRQATMLLASCRIFFGYEIDLVVDALRTSGTVRRMYRLINRLFSSSKAAIFHELEYESSLSCSRITSKEDTRTRRN